MDGIHFRQRHLHYGISRRLGIQLAWPPLIEAAVVRVGSHDQQVETRVQPLMSDSRRKYDDVTRRDFQGTPCIATELYDDMAGSNAQHLMS